MHQKVMTKKPSKQYFSKTGRERLYGHYVKLRKGKNISFEQFCNDSRNDFLAME